MSYPIKIAARKSPLSQAQVAEVLNELQAFHPDIVFEPILVDTLGDRDRTTSLKTLGSTDFFTKEVDQLVLSGECQIGIHSAKDLPNSLESGLELIALTKGVDSSDALVTKMRMLPEDPLVATSSFRREASVRELYPLARFVDLRGTIIERLSLLERGEVDGVVVAEAALIRLGLSHLLRERLPSTTDLQGKLAVVAREGDLAMKQLFACINDREAHSLSRA